MSDSTGHRKSGSIEAWRRARDGRSITRVLVTVLVAALVVLAASPAGAAKMPPKPKTASSLAALVEDAGLGCDDFERNDASNTIDLPATPSPTSEGHCTVNGKRTVVSVFESATERRAVLDAVPTLGCAAGTTVFRYVYGPTWTISTRSPATASKLVKALDAKKYTHRCDG